MSENLPNPDEELDALLESGGEHRVPGRNSSGKFKKGKSGNPNGRPKGTTKDKSSSTTTKADSGKVVIDFDAKEGATVAESLDLNAAAFFNSAWKSIANGNQRLGEIAFTQMLKDKGKGQNPFAGLGDLENVSPDELIELAESIDEGDLDV